MHNRDLKPKNRQNPEETKRSPWKRYLIAGAISLAAAGIYTIQDCQSCDCSVGKTSSIASEKASEGGAREGNRTDKIRLAFRQSAIGKKLAEAQSVPKPIDRLGEMIERDFPYDSLHCEMTIRPKKKDPLDEACEGNEFVKGVCGSIALTSYEFKFLSMEADELFQETCPDGKTCEPALIEEAESIAASGNPKELVHFINTLNDLSIQWSENGEPGGLLEAHFKNLSEARMNGIELDADEACVARLFYAEKLIGIANLALIDLVLKSPGSLGEIFSGLNEDSRPAFMRSLAFSGLIEPGQGDAIRAAFTSLSEGGKAQFLDPLFEDPHKLNIVLDKNLLRDLSAKGDPRLREAAGRLLEGYLKEDLEMKEADTSSLIKIPLERDGYREVDSPEELNK